MSYEVKYPEKLFEHFFYPVESNDINPFDELCLIVEFSQYIDVHSWDNLKFNIFIKNLKEKKDAEFTYEIEQNIKDRWIYKSEQNHIIINIWDFGKLDAIRNLLVTDDIIKKLEILSEDIDKFIDSLKI